VPNKELVPSFPPRVAAALAGANIIRIMLIDPFSATDVSEELRNFVCERRFGTILADPPWQFQNRTGKVAPEHGRLSRYSTMSLQQIKALPVVHAAAPVCHLYLWVPNALLPEGLDVMKSWGFQYKSNIIWHKIRKDGGPDGRGVGFYFRNPTLRGSRKTRTHIGSWKNPGQFSGDSQARTFKKARRAIRARGIL